MHRHLNVIICHDHNDDNNDGDDDVLYPLPKLQLSLTSMMEITLISNESIILSTGRYVKGNEKEMRKGMERAAIINDAPLVPLY